MLSFIPHLTFAVVVFSILLICVHVSGILGTAPLMNPYAATQMTFPGGPVITPMVPRFR